MEGRCRTRRRTIWPVTIWVLGRRAGKYSAEEVFFTSPARAGPSGCSFFQPENSRCGPTAASTQNRRLPWMSAYISRPWLIRPHGDSLLEAAGQPSTTAPHLADVGSAPGYRHLRRYVEADHVHAQYVERSPRKTGLAHNLSPHRLQIVTLRSLPWHRSTPASTPGSRAGTGHSTPSLP